ncbi:hypothetical protein [Enterococcus crotali]|nr:hypothetical protein [Enterococcus crotali]
MKTTIKIVYSTTGSTFFTIHQLAPTVEKGLGLLKAELYLHGKQVYSRV